MPKNSPKVTGNSKKPRLTLSELASYDDICTDALVDNVFFWSTIRKNRQKYNSGRGFSEDAVTKILFRHIVCDEDTKRTEAELLKLGGFKKFIDRLRTPREQEDFKRHLRKYISIWLPDCAWEVTTTNRYTIITHEAAVVARRDIRKGETINYLCGTLVEMTREEEKDLDLTRRDFSIVTSSRSKRTSLFLGPARFANHDCKANARLTTTGSWGMSVVAMRAIDEGEEITVTYGDDYFGENNCECLCYSCEQAGVGGWTKSDMILTTERSTTPDENPEPYSFRRKRKHLGGSRTPTTPDPETFALFGRRRSSAGSRTPPQNLTPTHGSSIKTSLTAVSSALARFSPEINTDEAIEDGDQEARGASEASVLDAPPLLVPSESELKQEMQTTAMDHISVPSIKQEDLEGSDRGINTAPTSVKRVFEPDDNKDGLPSSKKQRLGDGSEGDEVSSTKDTVVDTIPLSPTLSLSLTRKRQDGHVDDDDKQLKRPRLDAITSELNQMPSPTSEENEARRQGSRRSSSPASLFETDKAVQVGTPLSSQADIGTEHTTMVKVENTKEYFKTTFGALFGESDDDSGLSELDSDKEFHHKNPQVPDGKRVKARQQESENHKVVPDDGGLPNVRQPGDYVMTPVLLAEPFSRWVQCQTCRTVWVQPNGYYTRRECPRCERHSKVYGYRWPKVHDPKLERIKDHREVHRFLSASEEEELRSKTRVSLEGS